MEKIFYLIWYGEGGEGGRGEEKKIKKRVKYFLMEKRVR